MAYIGQEPGLGVAERFIFTASGGETSVSVDNDSLPLSYTANQVSVYLNGVKLVVGDDCIATNGSTITGLGALVASDIIEVIALSTFSPADTVPKSGGTFTGVITLPSPVINTGVSGTAVLDEDNMASDSATKIATQQSIKSYVDSVGTNSSITTLGTVTAGNISHADIVYPAGHVLQTILDTDTGTHRSKTSSSYSDVAGLSVPITSVGLNSKFLITATSSMSFPDTDRLLIDIKRVISGGATTNEIGGYTLGLAHRRQAQWGSLTFFYVDAPSQAIGTTITYSLRYRNDNNSTLVYWLHSGAFASMTVQEISV